MRPCNASQPSIGEDPPPYTFEYLSADNGSMVQATLVADGNTWKTVSLSDFEVVIHGELLLIKLQRVGGTEVACIAADARANGTLARPKVLVRNGVGGLMVCPSCPVKPNSDWNDYLLLAETSFVAGRPCPAAMPVRPPLVAPASALAPGRAPTPEGEYIDAVVAV